MRPHARFARAPPRGRVSASGRPHGADMAKPQFSCKVVVRPLPEQSDAAKQQYAYAYTVTIRNTGDTAAQLIARQWWITDHHSQVQEVRGLGVVGHQPLLNPDETFEY